MCEGLTIYDPDFEAITEAARKRLERDEHDALQDAIAGRSTGRLQKAFSRINAKLEAARTREFYDNLLQRLLATDPEYARLYTQTRNLLDQAKTLTQSALTKTIEALKEARRDLKAILKNASTLNGKAVFLDKDGNVRMEDGRIIQGEDLGKIEWNNSAASYEQYLQHKQKVEDLKRRKEELEHYQVHVLNPIQERMDDKNTRIDNDEFAGFQSKIANQAPEAIASEIKLKTIKPETQISAAKTKVLDF